MAYRDILVEVTDSVARVTLNRPDSLNAFTMDMREEIATAFEGLARDDGVRAVLLTGAGRAFSAGGDIRQWKDPSDRSAFDAIITLARRAVLAITTLPKPVVAMVNGDAVGGGCNLALSCDIIVASENARFGEGFIRLGMVPDWGGTYFVPRLVGAARARELLFTGRIISAPEAERIGLINRVVPPERLETEAVGLAKQLALGPTRAIGATKMLLSGGWLRDLPSALDEEFRVQWEVRQTEDYREGRTAFLQKRQPDFKGR